MSYFTDFLKKLSLYLYLLSLPSAVVGWPSSLGDIDDWPSADLLSIKKKQENWKNKTKQNLPRYHFNMFSTFNFVLQFAPQTYYMYYLKKTYPCVLLLRLIIVRFALKSQILQCKFLFKKNQEIRLFFLIYYMCIYLFKTGNSLQLCYQWVIFADSHYPDMILPKL